MPFDLSKLPEAFNAAISTGGWYKLAIATACGLYLLVNSWNWIPPPEPWEIRAATFFLLLFALLTIANFIIAAHRFFPVDKWLVHYVTLHREKRGLRGYIPYMMPKEREIIGYLLAKNQKTFCAEVDGGRAGTLLSRGIVMIVAKSKQRLDAENVPMTIPDHLWSVLEQHKDAFPYTPPDDEDELPPWRDSSDWRV
jgi:hypothetical protein